MLIEDLLSIYVEAYQYAKQCLKHPSRVADYVVEARKKASSFLYGIGGQCIHRGVMCADPFYEIDSNITRGKLTDKVPKRKNYYRYSFDNNGSLLLVEKYCDVDSVEVLCREGSIVYGLDFPVRFMNDLHATHITIYGNVLMEGRVEASFYSSKVELEADLNDRLSMQGREVIKAHFWGNVIEYENDVPVRYFPSIRCELYSGENETIKNQIVAHSHGYKLYLNDDGDVTHCNNIMDEHDDGDQNIRKLEKPIPRKQWDNSYGLTP